jgi:Na+-translocating ferredoxin:NAD+ oxidoreductase RnfA subunit
VDFTGDIILWVVGAAIAITLVIAIAAGVLWLIFRFVLEPRPRDRGDH